MEALAIPIRGKGDDKTEKIQEEEEKEEDFTFVRAISPFSSSSLQLGRSCLILFIPIL